MCFADSTNLLEATELPKRWFVCTGRIETHLLTFEANQCDRECRLRLLKAILQSELPDQVATSEKDAGSREVNNSSMFGS